MNGLVTICLKHCCSEMILVTVNEPSISFLIQSKVILNFDGKELQKQAKLSHGMPPVRRKEGWSILFNDALSTFYLRLYGIGHMVKDHSDSERGNPLPPHGLLFLISSKGSFICIIPHRITHTTSFVTPVVEHWLEREIAHEGSIRRPITRHL